MRLLVSAVVGFAAYIVTGYFAAVVIYQLVLLHSFDMELAPLLVHADVAVGIVVGILISHSGWIRPWHRKPAKPGEAAPSGPFS
jgi:hypothetical protein